MKSRIVTIDGPAGSGKSTVSRELARRLGWSFLDTGAMYRALAYAAAEEGQDLGDEKGVAEIAGRQNFEFTPSSEGIKVFLDRRDISKEIRSPEVTASVSRIASSVVLRRLLVEMQRDFAQKAGDMVTEGRDQGSVVFPDADVKFYLDAGVKIRAQRRAAELEASGQRVDIQDVMKAIEKRDLADKSREAAPLVCPEDAIVIDSSNISAEQVTERMLSAVKEII
ncbi:Cytidylate kinase [Sedimentisphaera cyanobacteriorum]|uniref:Cytidylate kinase n=1 Tax=Sedimentisphaera cyanobacteriorum TaxID=1940790 RepID=A0A1Q2HNB8_9BACT|nr:(d)CMP kinase [Sedimentisphaera cyanobacteriorum]AQQ08706.1 Cytidylate kinase [Sedimentisphaera cyanobacteriorum]